MTELSNRVVLVASDRSGRIEVFGDGIPPPGMLPIIRGPEDIVMGVVRPLARLAYDNKTLLVPGVPEAETEDEAVEAMLRFNRRLVQTIEQAAVVLGVKVPQ